MPVKIFCCYAHEDEALLDKLKKHLRPLQRAGLIDVWYDRDISAGTNWEQQIKEQLNTAQIILLLISPDFMASDYINNVELKQALERDQRGEATVIPIILRWVSWQRTPLGKLQALPKDGKPVKSWQDEDEALFDIAEGIRKVVEDLSINLSASMLLTSPEQNTFFIHISLTDKPEQGETGQAQRSSEEYPQQDENVSNERFKSLLSQLIASNSDDLYFSYYQLRDLISNYLNDINLSNVTYKSSDLELNEIQLPQTKDEIQSWYNVLSDRETCLVIATAILQGATAFEILRAANELFKTFENVKEHRQASNSEFIETTSLFPIPERSLWSRELLARTFTIVRRVDGAVRLFWSDNKDGFSEFGSRMLLFIADETVISTSWHSFLQQIEEWPKKFEGECSWKSAKALGAIWWYLDEEKFRRLANAWSRSDRSEDCRLAAFLMQGAYEFESVVRDEIASEPWKSFVLNELNSWVNKLYLTSNMHIGCAAARAYGLIGKKSPEIALHGLKHLRSFHIKETSTINSNDFNEFFVSIIESYQELAMSGHIRNLLADIAASVEELHLRQRISLETSERNQSPFHRSISLDVFFLIGLLSLSANIENPDSSYYPTGVLQTKPKLPDNKGRDVLLAGILTKEELTWRNHIATILCSAIVEGKEDFALEHMRHWAEIVLKEKGHMARELRIAYSQFMVQVGLQVNQWCNDFIHWGYRPPAAFDVYKLRLKLWRSDSPLLQHLLEDFAKEVLQRLNTSIF